MKFNDVQNVIAKVFTPDTYDCHFRVKKVRIGAHRRLLSALSPVFGTMFSSVWANSNEIEIKDVSPNGLRTFLNYFYKNEVILTTTNVVELLYLSDKYDIPQMIEQCGLYVSDRLNHNNAVETLGLSIKFNMIALNSKCIEFISRHTGPSLMSDAFLECNRKTLKAILEIEHKSCTEMTVFVFCIVWAKAKCKQNNISIGIVENLRTQLGDCFGLIQFKKMPREEFGELYEEWNELFHRNEIDEIVLHLCKRDVGEKSSV